MAARLKHFAYAESVRSIVADAAGGVPGPASRGETIDGEFDLILCDVPCSGTGTLARNPEIRHRLKPEELARQTERQRLILAGALRGLAPGGRLVYSTCSLEPEENERVVEVAAQGFRRVPVRALIEQLGGFLRPEATESLLTSAVRGHALRTLPGVHSCDGFFAVVLERQP
jgi:16S rRNA (cytosine967-C5)-methyltransferase